MKLGSINIILVNIILFLPLIATQSNDCEIYYSIIGSNTNDCCEHNYCNAEGRIENLYM